MARLSTDLSYLANPDRWKGLAAIVKIHSERLNKRARNAAANFNAACKIALPLPFLRFSSPLPLICP